MARRAKEYDPKWSYATLNDALETLEQLIGVIENSNPDEIQEILDEELPAVYAKLNYAYHSAKDGPKALDIMTDDELVSFPPLLPSSTKN